MHWDHELEMHKSLEINKSVFRFMESLHGLMTAHWDHEPRNRSARLQPGTINVSLERRTWRSWSSALRFMESQQKHWKPPGPLEKTGASARHISDQAASYNTESVATKRHKMLKSRDSLRLFVAIFKS